MRGEETNRSSRRIVRRVARGVPQVDRRVVRLMFGSNPVGCLAGETGDRRVYSPDDDESAASRTSGAGGCGHLNRRRGAALVNRRVTATRSRAIVRQRPRRRRG